MKITITEFIEKIQGLYELKTISIRMFDQSGIDPYCCFKYYEIE